MDVFKRTWIILIAALALITILSACGQDELAPDLTPIPTLPAGEQPELVEALQGGAQAGEPTAEPGGDTGDGGEDQLVALGESLFSDNCSGCHGAQDGAGPAFTGMAERAATRVEGMAPEDYIHESIVDPSAHVVEGFPDIMPKDYGEKFSDDEINGMVAYIIADSGGGEGDEAAGDEATPEATEQATEEAEAGDEATPEATGAAGAASTGDPDAGETLFVSTCSACHGEQDGPGPALTGMGERAEDRVEGMTAEEYIHESIVDPSAHVVEGFADIMPKTYDEQFSDEEIANLVAFILTQ